MTERLEEIEQFEQRFTRRYQIKKTVNAVICFAIAFCGFTAILWSVFVFHNSLFNRMRYMTFDGTIFTTVISFIFGIVCMKEAHDNYEITNRRVYFLRLSSATTEFVIFSVVMFGLTPLVPDNPDVSTYTGVMMHIIVPFLTLLSFMFNDAPIGKLKPHEPFFGTAYITLYAVIMLVLFGTGILSSDLAPYSFLDFSSNSLLFKLECVAGIYAVGYTISLMLSILNRKLSWIWFSDFRKKPV